MPINTLTTSLRRLARAATGRDGVIGVDVLGVDPTQPQQMLLDVKVRCSGRVFDLTVREGTTDLELVDMLLGGDAMYRLPETIEPKVIFDVGANIGVAALYFAARYPEAQIFCFEPLPANVELLCRNTGRNTDRIRVFPRGLSDVAGTFTYHMSADTRSFGGGTFHRIGGDPARTLELPVGAVTDAIADAGVDQVDVFKIDTEGAEWPILRGIPEQIRRNTQAFVGELHSVDDWDFCNTLAPTHNLALDKRIDRTCHPFLAVRKDLVIPESKPLAA